MQIPHEMLGAMLRIEKKLDEVLKKQYYEQASLQPLDYRGQSCPLCSRPVRYLHRNVDGLRVLVRECGCQAQPTELSIGE